MTVGSAALVGDLPQDGEGRPVRLPQLTASRLLGAVLVMGFHAYITFGLFLKGDARAPARLLLPALSEPAVSYFFVLTGFVFTWSYAGRRVRARDLYRGRLARFVPGNVLWWGLGILVILWTGFTVTKLGGVLTFFMLQGWVFDDAVVLTANPPAWSLSVDVLFYALFPLLLPVAMRMSSRARWTVVALLLLAQVELAAVSDLHHQTGYLYEIHYFPPSRLPEFLAGMMAALELRAGRLPRVPLPLAAAGAVASLVASRAAYGAGHNAFQISAVSALPSLLLVVALAQADISGKATWLSHPRLVAAGNWTFALYLLQIPVMRAAMKLADSPRDPLTEYVLALGACALCFVLAWVQYTWYERPLDTWIRGRGVRPDPVPAIAP